MPFDHERLDAYRVALDFIVLADDTITQLPRGRSHLADQLHRASTSIVLNIAEGAGKFSKPDKRGDYLSSAGSAAECAAIFDVFQRLRLVPTERHTPLLEAGQDIRTIQALLGHRALSTTMI